MWVWWPKLAKQTPTHYRMIGLHEPDKLSSAFVFFFFLLDFEQISYFGLAPLQHFQPSALVFLIKVETGCFWGKNKQNTELKKK